MPRTAVTLAIRHDGKEVLIFGRTVDINVQKAKFNSLRESQPKGHETIKELSYQESDGEPRRIVFDHPKTIAEHALREADRLAKIEAERQEVEDKRMAAEEAELKRRRAEMEKRRKENSKPLIKDGDAGK